MTAQLHPDEPMAAHVSWRAGGHARQAIHPADRHSLAAFLAGLPVREPVLFVGLGSNLLIRDGGYRGTVILMHNTRGEIRCEKSLIFAAAGVACPKLARYAAGHGFAGSEFLAGIPGTVGGALEMNAGCYGSETWDVVSKVETIDRRGKFHQRFPDDYEISYRQCRRRTQSTALDEAEQTEEWFTGAWFSFPPGDVTAARARIRDLLVQRVATQPLNLPNAGSVFRNPPGDFAARLIESCGLKGLTVGGAQVSTKHANFIVNPGGAGSAADIETLINTVRRIVRERTGVDLHQEVRILGEALQ